MASRVMAMWIEAAGVVGWGHSLPLRNAGASRKWGRGAEGDGAGK